ncbi:phage protease [Luteimonas sp. FXH3W]|uniref:Phage protease n=1 Tax=Aquilutibacter rugosus TaxID=3115820 RepID=A0ABU7UYL6_9GAMM
MKTLSAALNFELDFQGNVAPASIQLIPAGDIRGMDGRRWTMAPADADRVVQSFNSRGLQLPIDINHSTQLAAPAGGDSPAAGWIEKLEVRDGGIWGNVQWTTSGGTRVLNREYKYISPVFDFDAATKRVVRLVSAGLVNTPNLRLQALNSFSPCENDSMNRSTALALALSTALNLEATASDDDLAAAIIALKDKADETSTALNAERAKAPALDQYVPRADYDATLERASNAEAALAAKDKEAHDAAVSSEIDAALKAGKITPATVEYHRAACAEQGGLERFRAFVAAAPAVAEPSDLGARKPTGDTTALNAEQAAVARALGMSEDDYRAALALN